MTSLQSLSLKQTLETMVVDNDMQHVIEQFLVEYAKTHSSVLSNVFNKTVLYHVFFREQDSSQLELYLNPTAEIQLLNTFYTEQQAIDWVLANGRTIVTAEEYRRHRGVVLTIIPFNHEGNYSGGTLKFSLYGICKEKYLTYAFSQRGNEMLLVEHSIITEMDDSVEVIPWWLIYVDDNGTITRGCLATHLRYLHYLFEIEDAELIQQDMNELQRFHNNPDAYIREKRKAI